MREKTTVLVCDDHTLFREGIKEMLREQRWIEIVGEAHNGREAVNEAKRLRPAIVLLDLSMPDLGGLEATGRILQDNPKTKIVILTMYEEEEVITRCLRAGASGYVLKDAPRAGSDARPGRGKRRRSVLKFAGVKESCLPTRP